jgi:hypothetical protein
VTCPERLPRKRDPGSEAFFRQPQALRGDGDSEWLTIDLDFATNGFVQFRRHVSSTALQPTAHSERKRAAHTFYCFLPNM